MQQLTPANDKSSYYVTLDFFNEEGTPVSPTTATWTLTDGNGDIINQRDSVPIANPVGVSTTISLWGDDLAAGTTRADNTRNLTVEATYVSITTGDEKPLTKAVRFMITDLPAI